MLFYMIVLFMRITEYGVCLIPWSCYKSARLSIMHKNLLFLFCITIRKTLVPYYNRTVCHSITVSDLLDTIGVVLDLTNAFKVYLTISM